MIKALWIVNTVFPAPSISLGIEPPVMGGWMYGLAKQIAETDYISLSVATVYSGDEIKKLHLDNITYYLLPCQNRVKYDKSLENQWEEICSEFQPDIIHIHGTEFSHGLACMRKLPSLNYIISIQGLVSVYERYYYAGISQIEIFKSITFRDIIKRDSLFQAKNKFRQRGIIEKEYIKRTHNVIGRTSWDLAHTKALNPKVSYHFCNETLRDGFYAAPKWEYANCEPFTIFLSQASYPIKGLHQVLKAISLLKQKYPKIKLRIGGGNIRKSDTFLDRLRLSGYGKYINKIIKENDLENNVEFLGPLSEKQMIREYLRANVFICPSSIENSPNSLGEAQILGVPSIGAYVGGVPEFIEDNKTGQLYRFQEYEMLANNICNIFRNVEYAIEIGSKAIEVAESRHNKSINSSTLLNIYKSI